MVNRLPVLYRNGNHLRTVNSNCLYDNTGIDVDAYAGINLRES